MLWNEAVQKLQATKKPPFLHVLHLPAAGGRRLRWVDLPWDVAALAARRPGRAFHQRAGHKMRIKTLGRRRWLCGRAPRLIPPFWGDYVFMCFPPSFPPF